MQDEEANDVEECVESNLLSQQQCTSPDTLRGDMFSHQADNHTENASLLTVHVPGGVKTSESQAVKVVQGVGTDGSPCFDIVLQVAQNTPQDLDYRLRDKSDEHSLELNHAPQEGPDVVQRDTKLVKGT